MSGVGTLTHEDSEITISMEKGYIVNQQRPAVPSALTQDARLDALTQGMLTQRAALVRGRKWRSEVRASHG